MHDCRFEEREDAGATLSAVLSALVDGICKFEGGSVLKMSNLGNKIEVEGVLR